MIRILVYVLLMVLAAPVAAKHGQERQEYNRERSSPHVIAAPEIDAGSGTAAIALLTGVVLLLGERTRNRRRKCTPSEDQRE